MKRNWNLAALMLGILIFAGAARASGLGAESNPYRVIFQHSVFGLVPPPVVAEVNTAAPPPDITLNGIMTVLGRKYALFKLPADKGKNYLLAEGQSDGEIKLLSVDDRAGVIRVSNHGVVQTIALARPPALLNTPASASPGVAPMIAAGNNPRQIPAEGVPFSSTGNNLPAAATPFAQAGYAVMGGGNSQGSSSGNNPPSAGASDSQNSGGSSPAPKTAPEPWWVVASRNLEAARTATADLVNSGQAEPFPLTPYTPAGTPANLIGNSQLYFVGAAN